MVEHPSYFPQVLQVVPAGGYQLLVYFDDGSIHSFDATSILDQPAFGPLGDAGVFRSTLTVMGGTVAWDLRGDRDESACLDLDPLALYRETPEVEEPAWLREPAGPR